MRLIRKNVFLGCFVALFLFVFAGFFLDGLYSHEIGDAFFDAVSGAFIIALIGASILSLGLFIAKVWGPKVGGCIIVLLFMSIPILMFTFIVLNWRK